MPKASTANESFKAFVSSETNRRLLLATSALVLAQLIIFKLLYPFADFFSDSYSYIFAASANLTVSIWPIGYSKFLSAFHAFTHSDTALVAFQYLLLEVSSMYFYLTLRYFYGLGDTTRKILYAFFFLNPLFLYLSNYVNSDPLFAALSLIWFTQLLWIINKPRVSQVLVQAVVLFLCFTIRNNAYYYPFISLVAFILSRQPLRAKLLGIISPLVLLIPFIVITRNAAKNMTAKSQFSLFTGWQLANNSLYMYGHIKADSSRFPSPQSRELNRLSQNFYRQMPSNFDAILSDYVANFFIRQPQSPLKVYFRRHYARGTELDDVVNWGKASIVYSDFGKTVIEHHPIEYLRYFVLVNTKNYFIPPLEKLEVYNLGEDEVNYQAQDWFDYKTSAVQSVSKDVQGKILFIFPYIFLFVNVLSLGSIIWYLISKTRTRIPRHLRRTVLLVSMFTFCNFLFCITATIIVLRYEFFPMLILLSFSLVFVDWLESSKEKASPGQLITNSQPPDTDLFGLHLSKSKNMKAPLHIFLILLLCACHRHDDRSSRTDLSPLPVFSILSLDSSTIFNTKQIPFGQPLLLVYFRPDCPHCRQEIVDLVQHMEILQNTKIYFLAGAKLEDIKAFCSRYQLNQYTNITVGKDFNHSFFRQFRPSSVPYLAIYDKEKRLVKIYDEQVPADRLITILHN